MERRPVPAAVHEARLVRAARSLDRSRRLKAAAQEREERALAALTAHLAQTGQTQAVLGLFEILLSTVAPKFHSERRPKFHRAWG